MTTTKENTGAASGLSAAAGSAGIEPVDYEVYTETGVSWQDGGAHPFYTLTGRCYTLDNAKKLAHAQFVDGGELYRVKIVKATREIMANYSPNIEPSR